MIMQAEAEQAAAQTTLTGAGMQGSATAGGSGAGSSGLSDAQRRTGVEVQNAQDVQAAGGMSEEVLQAPSACMEVRILYVR